MKFREEFKMKKLFNTLIISAAAIIVGYWAIALPFHLFDTLTGIQMRIIFICEIFVYFAVFSAFFIIKEAKAEKKNKERKYKEKHIKKLSDNANHFNNIKQKNFHSAA